MKKLPIGISDFKTVIEEEYAYVDKTLLIQEILTMGHQVYLFLRPRRFGKSINLSMLRYFFEKTSKKHSHLFKDLAIWKHAKYKALQGQFPIIFLTFKDVKWPSWKETYSDLCLLIADEFTRHQYLLKGTILSPAEKKQYRSIINGEGSPALYRKSLLLLSRFLHRAYKKKAIVLIDEYDTPAHAAYLGGYYDSFIEFLRTWLSAGLKDNPHLERGVLTGILRIAKESIFSGLNNVSAFTVLQKEFGDKFGLLESEVKALLREYNLIQHLPEMRRWYDGYHIGASKGIYNPWSILQCISKKGDLAPYWVNTSDNALMKSLIAQGTEGLKQEIETLLQEGAIEKTIEEGTVFSALKQDTDLVWSLLVFGGYLSIEAPPSYRMLCTLRIPNMEVRELYRSMILDWFKRSLHTENYHLLLHSLTSGDIDTFARIFQEFMLSSVSIFDVSDTTPEKVYHAFVLGLLVGLRDTYEVKSNRESGYGRYDVMLIPKDPSALGIIMEFKKVDRLAQDNLELSAASALQQIEEKCYAQELHARGIQRILKLALAFQGKQVLIRAK